MSGDSTIIRLRQPARPLDSCAVALQQLYVVLSLPNFRLERSRSLSLARGCRRIWRGEPARPARAAWAVQRLLAARW